MSLESANGTTRKLEVTETPERTVEFSDPTQLAAYEKDMLEDFKRILGKDREITNQKYLEVYGPLSVESRAGLQAIGTLRVMFYHWDRALGKVKNNPSDGAAIAKLRQFDTKINDLIEVMNVAIEKQFANSNQSGEAVEAKAAPAMAPLVLDASARVLNNEENDTSSQPEVAEAKKSTLEPLVLTPSERVAEAPDTIEDVKATIQRLETDIAELEVHKLYPDRIAAKMASLERAKNKLADLVSKDKLPEAEEEVVLPEPLDVETSEKFQSVVDELDTLPLDEQDDAFVASCISNYQKAQAAGNTKLASSYLRNLEEVVERKRSAESAGMSHGEIEGRLAIIAASLEDMRVVDEEGATTVSVLIDNVRRLLAEQNAAEDQSAYEQKIQQTYLSLERTYRDFTTEEVAVEPVTLVEPAMVEEIQNDVSSVPTEQSVTEAFRRQENVGESLRARLRVWWSKLRPSQQGMIAGAVLAMLPNIANQYTDVFQTGAPIEASISGIGLAATWGSAPKTTPEVESGVTKLKVTEVLDGAPLEVAKVMVMPPIPEVMEEPIEPINVSVKIPAVGEVVTSPEMPQLGEVDTAKDTPPVLSSTVPSVSETLPDRYAGVVKHGQVETYPDNQLEKFFGTIDTKGLPTELVSRLKSRAKVGFYADADALRSAGFSTNDANLVFDGEKINYEQPVEGYKSAIAAAAELLAAPHTEVVISDSNMTNTMLQSYASDLAVVPMADRAALVAKALTSYVESTPDALTTLGVTDIENIPSGTIVDLRPVASYLGAAMAEYAREQATSPATIESEAPSSNSVTEPTPEEREVISPETYPGGELAFSRDYQVFLGSLGITETTGSWYDAMFAPSAPSNKAILDETVGDLTKLMISESPSEQAAALATLGITEATARKVYDLIAKERASGNLTGTFDNETTVKSVLRNYVLKSGGTLI